MAIPLVTLTQITKRYGPVTANCEVDFDLRPGEIHALLGENGSGKTTLMSILYGLTRPDSGEIRLGDVVHKWRSPQDAIANGIAMIPQQFRLVPSLTAAENLIMGLKLRGRYGDRLREVENRLNELSSQYGLKVDPSVRIESLSMGERQRIEILRALYHNSRIILMDEPTSVLTPPEVENLYVLLSEMIEREQRSIVLTTHKIREVLAISHRVTVLRRGRKIDTVDAQGLTPSTLVEMMIGARRVATRSKRDQRREDFDIKNPLIEICSLVAGKAASGLSAINDVCLNVCSGEILGIAGIEGNGQSELEAVLAGLLEPTSGHVNFADNESIAYIPSDRNRHGVIPSFTVAENLLLRQLATAPGLGKAPIYQSGVSKRMQELVERYEIYPSDPSMRIRQLSGGNAQKVLLARELSRRPRIVLAAQPTLGLDVTAASFVRNQLLEQAEAGAAIIVISSDLDELMGICDSVAVMYAGEICGVWPAQSEHLPAIGAAMAGLQPCISADLSEEVDRETK
jgi:ABC-type uncharacterized transport system ATPase subunit